MSFRTGTLFVSLSALALAGGTAAAQDTTTWQLPPAQTQKPTAQGPVVPDAPPPRVSTTPTPVPTSATPPAVPAPTASAAPSPVVSPEPARSPTGRATASPDVQRAPVAAGSPTAPARPDALPSPAAPLPPPDATGTAPLSAATASAGSAVAQGEDEGTALPVWLWFAGAAMLVVAGFAFVRRGRKPSEQVLFEPPLPNEDNAGPAESPPPLPAVAAETAPLLVDLVASRMSASLVNATLAYRLRILAQEDLSQLAVRGGMTSAHASRPAEELLNPHDAPVLHGIAGMAAGESIEISGEIRLPLAEITPIRHGTAAMFVPLVRIEITGIAGSRSVSVRSAFVVGIEDGGSGARLQPFRLDHGPRVYARVGQRELVVPSFA